MDTKQDETKKEAYTPRSGRVGNFLVNEEVIDIEGAEILKRIHVSDVEHGWEVVIPQTYAAAFNIVSLALDEDTEEKDVERILHWVFDNWFLVTTCLDGQFHTLIRDIALLGFTPAVNKKSVKERERVVKNIKARLKVFEFPAVMPAMTEEEDRQAEIAAEAKDILEENAEAMPQQTEQD